MNTPVLTDLAGRDFTEGDFVVYSSTNGIRYGEIEWIKQLPHGYYHRPGDPEQYRVYISLEFHQGLDNLPGKMYAKKQGYDYNAAHFLKVSKLTDT